MTDQPNHHTDLITEMIARSPAAQPRERAIASIQARRSRLLLSPAPDRASHQPPATDEIATIEREPMPMLNDTDAFAAGFWQRLKERESAKHGR